MYKSRLLYGDVIFLMGFIPALVFLNGINTDDAFSALSVVGLFVFFVLGPFMLVGSVLSLTAVIRLTSIEKINQEGLKNGFGLILISIGWLIAVLVLIVLCMLIYGLFFH